MYHLTHPKPPIRQIVLMVLLALVVVTVVGGTAQSAFAGRIASTSESIPAGQYYSIEPDDLETIKEIKYDISVVEGDRVDIYIMISSEYDRYSRGEDFDPVVQFHNTPGNEGSYMVDDIDETYYVVIDNLDNAKGNDAVPSGDVTVEVEVNFIGESEILNIAFFFALVIILAMVMIMTAKLLLFPASSVEKIAKTEGEDVGKIVRTEGEDVERNMKTEGEQIAKSEGEDVGMGIGDSLVTENRDAGDRDSVIEAFREMECLDGEKATMLYESGFTSVAALKQARTSELVGVKGITPGMAHKITEQVKDL